MARETADLAIVFADIAGSTRLYETLGDTQARQLVSECLALLTQQTEKFDGTVIKTIGDEIMCTFPSAELAVESAMGMQEAITIDLPRMHEDTPASLTIRIGLHYGSAILEGGDVFGDAVNVAARMAGLAKGGQIITTQPTAEELPPALAYSTRHLDQVPVKGKSELIDIFEVVWQPDNATRIATDVVKHKPREVSLKLKYHDKEVTMTQATRTLVLGRSKKADMVVNDSMASREHARIECRRDKFVLTDQSTNGTYVLTDDGPAYLRREETTLVGEGKISFGRNPNDAEEVVVFSCE